MAGLYRVLSLVIGFILRTSIAQTDPCTSLNSYAMYVQSDGIGNAADGIYRAVAGFTAASAFSTVPVSTDENPTAISYDVVEDLLYWAGNDVTIGKYIKKSPITGGTAQETSLITCTGTGLGVATSMIPVIIDANLASSTMATNAGPVRARLNLAANMNFAGGVVTAAGAWSPTYADISANPHWISVNFLGRPTITGIQLQGRQDMDMWTLTYWVEYSQDYDTWTRVKDMNGADATFTGNTDRNTVVTQMFHEPVAALYLRILPRTWVDMVNTVGTSDVPALRFEVLGCKVDQCNSGMSARLGIEDGSILDSQLSALTGMASNGRLGDTTGWAATGTMAGAPNGEYIQVLFGGRVTVTEILVQSAPSGTDYPTKFNIQYWDDAAATPTWKTIQDNGNADVNFDSAPVLSTIGTTTGVITLDPAQNQMVSTTGLRLFPRDIMGVGSSISARFEVKGCRDPIVSHMVVEGTCGLKKIYWIESGHGVGQKIYYADLESASPTALTRLDITTLPTPLTGTIVDVTLHNDLLYFARQESTSSSYIHSANLNGAIQQSRQVSSTNGNIQSIAIDAATDRVYYSLNPGRAFGNMEEGRIGYADLTLSSSTTIYEIAATTMTFKPFDIGVNGDYVYMLKDKASIYRVQKSLTVPNTLTSTSNTPDSVVGSLSTNGRLSTDLQFFNCINYPEVKLEVDTYSKFENESQVVVNIQRAGDLRCCSNVEIDITEMGAVENTDFSLAVNPAVSGTPRVVRFNADATSVQLQFSITPDNNVLATIGEGDETFRVTLNTNNIACATLGSPSATTITIKDYNSCYYFADPPTVTYTETDADATQTIDIKREGYLQQAGEIVVNFVPGTAKQFTDYDITTNTVTFDSVTGSPSDQTKSVSVTIKGDTVIEETSESFQMQLLVLPATSQHTSLCPTKLHMKTVTITDNDFNVFLQKTNIEVSESSPTVSIPVCREGQTIAAAVVPYSVHDDSAKQGQDYNDANSPRQVTIPIGQMCANIIISILDDTVGEYFEAFYVSITLGTANKQTYVQIKDNDITIKIERDRYEITESNDLVVKLLREGDSTNDQDVSLVAVQGDAVAGSDFVAFDGIEFKAGERERTAVIDIIDDSDDEQSEDFTLRLINGAGQILSSATVTILDNDDPPPPPSEPQTYQFDRRVISVNENDRSRGISVEVTRTRVEQASSVTVTTSPGTATSGSDFIPLTQTVLQFARGVSGLPVFVEVVNDQIDESDETFTLQLSNPSDGTISGNTNVVVTIVDDDEGGDGGDGGDGGGDGGNGTGLSTAAIIAIGAGAAAVVLALMGLLGWGAVLLARPPPPPPQLFAQPPAGYPQYARAPYNNRAFRPV